MKGNKRYSFKHKDEEYEDLCISINRIKKISGKKNNNEEYNEKILQHLEDAKRIRGGSYLTGKNDFKVQRELNNDN